MRRFIESNWNQIKQKLQKKYPRLSSKDLYYRQGTEKDLLHRLQLKLNKEKAELLSELKQLITESK